MKNAQSALLLAKEVIVPAEYSYFADIFLEESANIFLEQTKLIEHAIELEKGKQPPYRPIYILGLVEFETFKTYIKTNLANSFIQASKSPTVAPILFVRKLNSSLCLYVNYRGLNNFFIKKTQFLLLYYHWSKKALILM